MDHSGNKPAQPEVPRSSLARREESPRAPAQEPVVLWGNGGIDFADAFRLVDICNKNNIYGVAEWVNMWRHIQ